MTAVSSDSYSFDTYTQYYNNYLDSLSDCTSPVLLKTRTVRASAKYIEYIYGRKSALTLARWKAVQKLRSNGYFDLSRSYKENNGNVKKLYKDVDKIFWFEFRKEFPTQEHFSEYPEKYIGTCLDNYNKLRGAQHKHRKTTDAINRTRGREKRALREKQFRETIGDEEFNRRMQADKAAKASRGGTDEQYLAYLKWRKSPEGQSFNHISKESSKIKVIKSNSRTSTGIRKKTHLFKVLKSDFNHLLEVALAKNYNIELTIKEGATVDETPHQYVILENTVLHINGAKRQSTISGKVYCWIKCPQRGLMVNLDADFDNYHRTYPKQWATFENYRDITTGQFIGNPKKGTIAHKLYQVRGSSLECKITSNSHIITMKTDSYLSLVSRETVLKLLENDTLEDIITNTIEDRILKKKQDRAHFHKEQNKKIDAVNKSVSAKNGPGSTSHQLIELGIMLREGLLTREEFELQKKALLS
jgi:hypothetical protein